MRVCRSFFFTSFFLRGAFLQSFFLLVLLGSTPYAGYGQPAEQGYAAGDELAGRVTRVTDGDSLILNGQDGQDYTIRLYGIDAPEWGQPHGREAGEALSARVSGRDVLITVQDIDIYGRLVGTVWLDGGNINLWLVQEGHAWWYQFFARDVTELEQAEAAARAAGIGLWAHDEPVAPWNWRRRR